MSLVSVVVPLFNREKLISYTLNSLHPNHHPGVAMEVIVVDDGSTDRGVETVTSDFPWVKVVRNTVNRGASFCRNRGLELAKGSSICFVDSDDLLEKDFFATRVNLLETNPDICGAYGPWVHFESNAAFDERHVRPRKTSYPFYSAAEHNIILENLLIGWFIPINAFVWRAESVLKSGGFNEQLAINQDVDFCFRQILGGPVCGIPSPRALIRIHQGERVGRTISESTLSQMLDLRKYFLSTLRNSGMLMQRHSDALATYAFHLWADNRKSHPEASKLHLDFSRSLNPNLKLKGSLWFRTLALCLGNERAVKVKQQIQS